MERWIEKGGFPWFAGRFAPTSVAPRKTILIGPFIARWTIGLRMFRAAQTTIAILGLLLVVLSVLLRGFWYPGITGDQKAEILLFDDKFPSRALFGIGFLSDSTLLALASKSANYKSLSPTGRAMITRIALCESGARFVTFAESLLSSPDESVRNIGRISITHRGLATTSSIPDKNVFALLVQNAATGDAEQLQIAREILASSPQVVDAKTKIRIEELIKLGGMRSELAEAILLSSGLFSRPDSTTLLADLISATTSPYRISAFWALHFSDHLKAVAVAETFISAQPENRATKVTLLGIDIQRSGTKVGFPTAYSEYLCK